MTNRVLSIVVASVLVVGFTVNEASADTERRGACSGSSGRWELDLETQGGRIEIDFEVNTAQAGRTWHVKLWHNGARFFAGTRVTDHEGDFDVERHTADSSGTDRYRARATQGASGAACQGIASI